MCCNHKLEATLDGVEDPSKCSHLSAPVSACCMLGLQPCKINGPKLACQNRSESGSYDLRLRHTNARTPERNGLVDMLLAAHAGSVQS